MLFKKTADSRKAPPVSTDRKKELGLFQKGAGIRFRSLELLNLAFCHRSYANEQSAEIANNERLEFLGDAVLGLIVSEYLIVHLPEQQEGILAKIKSFVVSEESLSEIAKRLKVDNFILIGRGEEYSGGRTKKTLLADALEAIIGAYFLDSGFSDCKKFVLGFMVPEIQKVIENRHKKDYKTLLQEYVQKRFKTYPKYVLVKKSGPDHDKTFWIEVKILEKTYGPGQGKNKKEAEQDAASIAYRELIPREDHNKAS
ncbi:MAG: ribonuclease III [Spirochaetales bacterium]